MQPVGFDGIADKLSTVYDEALEAGELSLYFASEVIAYAEPACAVPIDVHLVPTLALKPAPPPKDFDLINKPKGRDPFLLPVPKHEYVAEVEVLGGKYVVMMNKFCFTPRHAMIVTRDFKPQAVPLEASDLLAAYTLIKSCQPSTELMLFHNNGNHSGASQPHRHFQVMEYQRGPPPMERLAMQSDVPSKPTQLDLPYVHLVSSLNFSDDATQQEISDSLHSIYTALIDAASAPTNQCLLITANHIHLIPRSTAGMDMPRKDGSGTFRTTSNSLLFAGYCFFSPSNWEDLKAYGVVNMLTELGVKR